MTTARFRPCLPLAALLAPLTVAVLGCATASANQNTLTSAEEKAGWKLLFDGKTTTGWRGAYMKTFPNVGWEVKDGNLSVLESGGAESTHGGDIVTVEQYGDFELSFEFQLTKAANSGVKYFVQESYSEKGKGSAIGLEFQVLDDLNHADASEGVGGNRTLSSLYDLIPAENLKRRPLGEWNHARIVVRGSHVEHWFNGQEVVAFDRHSQAFRALVQKSKYAKFEGFGQHSRGHILLQDHGNRVSYRNIKIRKP